MPPLHDFDCLDCGAHLENVLIRSVDDWEALRCPDCNSGSLQRTITAHGGYTINGSNTASVRPKRAGSFKGGKSNE